MFFSLFPKTASSSVFIVDEDSVLIATEPHFGQRAGSNARSHLTFCPPKDFFAKIV